MARYLRKTDLGRIVKKQNTEELTKFLFEGVERTYSLHPLCFRASKIDDCGKADFPVLI
jgi:hypothetical protein